MTETDTAAGSMGDRPIDESSKDRLARGPFAELLARQILRLPSGDSHVIGLLGPWGSGKTSIINLASRIISAAGMAVVHFNPWLFSDAEQLATTFFHEMAAQLSAEHDKERQELGKRLTRYGEALTLLKGVPHVGGYVGAAGGTLTRIAERIRKRSGGLAGSLYEQRKQVEHSLLTAETRVLVIVDDLDRLLPEEIREVMRLVRLTADFPKVVYLLAFDRDRVAKMLSSIHVDGEEFIEKILQITFDVPHLREADLRTFFLNELEGVITGRELASFDQTDWQTVYIEVIAPLLRTPRDVRRVMNVLPFAFDVTGQQVSPIDVIALEVLRVTMPTVFGALPKYTELLTGGREWDGRGESPLLPLLALVPTKRNIIERLCARLFPMTRQYIDRHHYGAESRTAWRRERRVASPEIFRFFFEKSLPADVLPAQEVQRVFEALVTPTRLDEILAGMNSERLENMLGQLEDYEERFPENAADAAIPVLFHHSLRLREDKHAMFDLGADMALARVVLRLIRRVPEQNRVDSVAHILANTHALSRKLDLVQMIGPEKGIGHDLVTEDRAKDFAAALERECLAAPTGTLARERDLYIIAQWLYSRVTPPDAITTWLRSHASDATFLTALLRSALGETLSQGLDEPVAHRQEYLPWDLLEAALTPDQLAMMDRLSANGLDERSSRAITLAKRYRQGWRPPSRSGEKRELTPMEKAAWLLSSGVYRQRMGAYVTLHEGLRLGTPLPEDVLGQLQRIVVNRDYGADERIEVIELLLAANRTDTVLRQLSEQWVSTRGVEPEVSARIAKVWSRAPQRLPELLTLLEALPVNADGKRTATDGLADVFAMICNLLQESPASIQPDTVLRARELGTSFALHERLRQQLGRLNRMIEGER